MGRTTRTHAKGTIDGRFFILQTIISGKSKQFVALERVDTGWKRHCVSRARLATAYKTIKASA